MRKLFEEVKIVAIGTSAGGITALHTILPAFTGKKVAVVLVIHLPPQGPNLLPSLFADECEFRLKEAEPGEALLPGTITIAPPGYHMSTELDGTVSLSNEEEVNFSRPSIDILFESVAFAYKKSSMGILLTGANHDGAQGMKALSGHGAITVVQDPQTAEYPTMPESALRLIKADYVLDLEGIAGLLRGLK